MNLNANNSSFNDAASPQPPFTNRQSGERTMGASIGRAIGYLAAVGCSLLGLGVAVVFWIFAAIAYDGMTLFGCSDGSKYPDQATGNTCVGIGFAALVIGLLVAGGITYVLRRTNTQ
jgi:hypothetical protein